MFGGVFVPDYLVVQVRLKNMKDAVLLRNVDLRGYGTRAHYQWLDADGLRRIKSYSALRSSLPVDVAVNASTDFPVFVTLPSTPGRYTLRLSLIQEGITEFSAAGSCKCDIPMSVPIDAGELQRVLMGRK
jgi:hypothetical protein